MKARLVLLSVLCLATARAADAPPGPDRPPVHVSYDMPMDGFVALDIHDKASGRLVRRLVGETYRKQGQVSEEWDLKDKNGQPVPPGAYAWNALVRPPFKLTYETSVYNAGIPAWFAPPPAKGGGSWLADHTMASAIAAQKDRIWISAPCAESGHALIATDLDGVKEWGINGPFGFDGPFKVAADERCAYGVTKDMLFRVDPTRDFAFRRIFTMPVSTPELPWPTFAQPQEGSGGLAVRDGKLYLAVKAQSSWLRPSFVSDALDPSRCQPLVYLFKGHGRRDKKVYPSPSESMDELELFYATFLCDRTPANTATLPNFALGSMTQASFGDAPGSGPFKGSVVVAFNEPIAVSSIAVPDGSIEVLAMKPGHTMPANKSEAAAGAADVTGLDLDKAAAASDLLDTFKESAGMSDDWITLPNSNAPGRPGIVTAPAGGLRTAALRFKVNRLAYALIMNHRFEDVAPKGKLLFHEGSANRSGGWGVDRKQVAITETKPAAVALVWKDKQQLRGLSFVRPPAGHQFFHCRFAIDAWVGATLPDPAKALDAEDSWRQVRFVDYDQVPMLYQVEFGGLVETAGVRVRFVNVNPQYGFQAGFDGLVAYHPIGGDPTNLPPDLCQRVTEFKLPPADDDKHSAEVVRHIPLPNAGDLAFDAQGGLYCVAGREAVTVPLKEGETSRVVIGSDKLEKPLALAFGPDGLLYVTDNGPRIVKVFKPDTGEQVRTIGTPGGLVWGKWDPSRLSCPSGIAVDNLGRPWVTDWCWTPKRIQRFTADGKPDKEFLGPTQYGGGGTMDSRDRRFIYYDGMKFVINWDDYSWKLDSRLGPIYVDRTVYWKDRRYLVGPSPGCGQVATIAEEEDNLEKLMAQAGCMKDWTAVKEDPAIRAKFGGLDLARQFFVWSDLNGDRQPQPEEVQRVETDNTGSWTVGEDLTFVNRGGTRLKPTGIRPDGVPVYDITKIEPYNAAIPPNHNDNPWGDEKGRIFTTGAKLIDADGKTILWQYYNEYNRHDGFYMTPFGHDRPPGVLNWEHSPTGHIKVKNAQGVLEDYYISNSDAGDWFCFSADGLLAGCIMGGPAGYGRGWPAEWVHGKTDVSNLRPGQEHYQGCVVSTDDGHVYAVVGHNHITVVRVDGLEKVQRLKGELTVSAAEVEQTRLWQARELARQQAAKQPKIAMMLRSGGSPDINGSLEDWPNDLFVNVWETVHRSLQGAETSVDAVGALAYDTRDLYVALRALDASPLKNSAEDLPTLFKNGDAAELTLGMDTNAPPSRLDPVAGDLRLLFAMVKGKPVTVLYKPVDPKAPADLHHEFSSPIGRVQFDRVEVIPGAKVAFQTQQSKDGPCWVMEASVPWAALGVRPPAAGAILKGDLGYLESDENGLQTVGRKYWSGRSQTVVSDTPSEARLNPSLWGQFRTVNQDKKLRITVIKGLDDTGTGGEEDIQMLLEGNN